MAAHRSEALRLYRRILSLHKQKLDPRMRVLGDQYVRDEFKRHKNAQENFVPPFMREWQKYEALLSQKQDRFGEEMAMEDKALLDAQQKEKLQSLQEAAKTVGESMT